jgi:secreted PhoX family phosphatase
MIRTRASLSFQNLLLKRITRRGVLQAGVMLAPLALAGCRSAIPSAERASTQPLGFRPIKGSAADAVILPHGYMYDTIIRWGESLVAGVPDLDASKLASGILFDAQAAEWQSKQFGQNCDAIQFFALDASGDRGILCVNNEFTDDALMYPGHPGFAGTSSGDGRAYVRRNPQLVAVSQAAQGISIIEIVRQQGRWSMVKNSRFARRITARTPIDIGGPARGAALMRTGDDPDGARALGTFGNCAGGRTPWGTYLSAEENIQDYFGNFSDLEKQPGLDRHVLDSHRRFAMWSTHSLYGWEAVDSRFDLTRSPTEPFRFGWIVEIDPLDPQRAPVKRTSLGRCAHEGASPFVAHSGHVAVYMGDDAKFEHVYKFVSKRKFDAKRTAANRDLLDEGILYAARFDASGSGEWLPLVYDEKGPLNKANGFHDQAEVLIKARAAASLLGATPMDRPEDIEVNPVTGHIYVACTNNDRRTAEATSIDYRGREIDAGTNAANPRALNRFGHIIEIRESGDDHTSLTFAWDIFLLGGDPAGGSLITSLTEVRSDSVYYAGYTQTADLSPIGSPDNLGFDRNGNLWIVTDGAQPDGSNDGCWVCPTSGPQRGQLQRFMSGPVGAEICGCQFTPDNETLFLSIQHPGGGGSVTDPRSHWPDGPGTQPRSSVIAVRKEGGGKVGS